MLNQQIFHKYDIRGIYGQTLTDEDALLFGKALGTYLKKKDLIYVVIGADNRPSSPALKAALLKGLVSTGIHATDIGVATTPMVLFAASQLEANAGIVITASHNSNEYNGIKVSVSSKPLIQSEYLEIKAIADAGLFLEDTGNELKQDIWPVYKQSIAGPFRLSKPIKIGIDTKGGACTNYAQDLFTALGCQIVTKDADLVLTFDTDGDRLVVLDKHAKLITNDLIAGVFAQSIIENYQNCSFVFNVSVLQSLINFVLKLGASVNLSATGYPNITSEMDKTKSIFGAEVSGHYFFRDRHLGYNDAFYAGARLLEIIDKKGSSIEHLVGGIPVESYTEEVHAKIPETLKRGEFEKGVGADFSGAHMLTIDGVRFTYPDSAWGIIRLSNTEDLVSVRAGAPSNKRLEEVKDIIKTVLSKYAIQLQW